MSRLHQRIGALVVAGALLGAGCGAPAAAPQPTTVVVLADTTQSTAAAREIMVQTFSRLLETVPDGTALSVVPITAASVVSPVEFRVEMPRGDRSLFGTNAYTQRLQRKKLSQKAEAQFAEMLEREPPERPGTAIIDGLSRVKEVLGAEPGGRRVVVILSDLIEQEIRDFTTLKEPEVSPFLQQLQAQGQIPDFAGVCVYAGGVSDGDQIKLDRERVLAIQQFWRQFFAEAGARLVAYEPKLTVIRLDACSAP